MSDNLPGFSADDQAKPPSRRELVQEEREWKALLLYMKHKGNVSAVRKEMKLSSNSLATVLINRAAARYSEQRADHVNRAYFMQQHLSTMALMDLAQRIENGEAGRFGDLKNMLEFSAKLNGTLAQPERDMGGNTYVLAAGGDINLVPKDAEVVDTRAPWERPELIEGEVVE